MGGEDNTAFHHFDIYRRAGGKTGGFQPLTFQGDGGNTAVIRVAARLIDGYLPGRLLLRTVVQ